MKSRFFINGEEVNEPNNYPELNISIDYNDDSINEKVSINEWEIGTGDGTRSNDAYTKLKQIIENGLIGGTGVTEGVPFQIELDSETGQTDLIFDGYLDLWNALIDNNNSQITAPATEQASIDWLNQVADSVSFEYLHEKGILTSANYIPVPYVINKKQDAAEILLGILTFYLMVRQLRVAIENLTDTLNDINVLYFSSLIRAIAQIIQIIVLVAAMVKLLKDLYNLLIQPVKFHYGMYVRDLLTIGLNELGMKFESSILKTEPYNNLLILPEKYNLKENNTGAFEGVVGLIKPQPSEKIGYYKRTLGQLIREIKLAFDAKIVIRNKTVFLEKQDFNIDAPKYQLPPYESAGFRYNADEFISNTILRFLTDTNDRNTIQEYYGTSVQIIQEPKVVNNQQMKLTRNYQEIIIPFAQGKRKTSLTFIEKRLEGFNNIVKENVRNLEIAVDKIHDVQKAVVKAANKVIKALKTIGIKIKPLNMPVIPPQVGRIIEDLKLRFDGTRIGLLKMESDFITVPKLIILNSGRNPRKNNIPESANHDLAAHTLYERFYFTRPFVENSNGVHNQGIVEEIPEIPFTNSDYQLIKNNNHILTNDGETAKLLSLKFDTNSQTATGTVKIKKVYTRNLKYKVIIPDGK